MSSLRIYNKLLIIIVVIFSSYAFAADDADALYEAEKWPAAVAAYESRVAVNPEDTNAWVRLAVSARHAAQYDTALAALEKAEEQGFSALQIGVERIRIDVLQDNIDEGVAGLQVLVDNGFTAVGFIRNDPILSQMSGNEAYETLTAELEKLAYPCENDPIFAEFDFWIGEWDVHSGGVLAGSNVIKREQRGCYLSENWTNVGGGGGHSINYVDKITNEWVQIWNAAGGSQINIRGGMTDDGMLLTGTLHDVASGTTRPFRGLWTPLPDGRVRQYFEHSDDDGETWVSWFEGFYTRKAD